MQFTTAEVDALATSHLAVFEGRVIYDAQSPIEANAVDAIQEHCAGPIPDGLLALWNVAFGGMIDYDLRASFGDHHAAFSFRELFYPGSNGYQDLWGWIEHEEELAQEAAEEKEREWSGKLEYLPFGGFEYLDRLYVQVAPGKDYGAVFAWMQGLPPAWRLRLHQDSVARIADDVPALFRSLALERDPAKLGEEYGSGKDLLAAVEALSESSPAGASAATKLREVINTAILNWRAAIEDGTIAKNERLRRLALETSARDNDVQLAQRLADVGCDLTEKISGGGTALDHALMSGSMPLVRFLLDRNLPVTDAIRNGASVATKELVEELLARGAEPDRGAALTAVREGHLEGGVMIANALFDSDPLEIAQLMEQSIEYAEREEDSARRVESGQMGSNETPDDMRNTAMRYREFAKRLSLFESRN